MNSPACHAQRNIHFERRNTRASNERNRERQARRKRMAILLLPARSNHFGKWREYFHRHRPKCVWNKDNK